MAVTSAASGRGKHKRTATERRLIITQEEAVPEMKLKVCKDAQCGSQINLVGGVATVNANRRKPDLFLQLRVKSPCAAKDTKVGWSTSMADAHISTEDLLKTHAMTRAKHEIMKIKFDYTLPLDAEYSFSITAKCSQQGSSSARVSMDIVMNYGPSGGKMKVTMDCIFTTGTCDKRALFTPVNLPACIDSR